MSERLEKGVSFDKFQEKVKHYALKNYNHAEDVVELIMKLKDPIKDFEAKYASQDLSEDDQNSPPR